MNTLFRKVLIVDDQSEHHLQQRDVLIREGVIAEIGKEVKADAATTVVEGNGACLSTGWFDLRVSFREPGEEQKETIRSGQHAAAQGGFTGVLLMPSTKPALQSRADIEAVKVRASGHAVEVYPCGALTVNREGKELTEMYDMVQGGAVAFTDDKRVVSNSGVMLRALQYSGNVGGKVIAFADDPGISGGHTANESAVTTLLGFKGSPAFAEALALNRDIQLSRYADQPVHFSGISSKDAVDVLRTAKKSGAKVTAEVAVHHLLLTDDSLNEFDSNFKVNPPLRGTADREALVNALVDGTIDAVVSDHAPEDTESKEVEFDYAAFGVIGLETLYGVLKTALGKQLTPELTAKILSINPRAIAGVNRPAIKVGETANLTLFNPDERWTFSKGHIRSRSSNSPFIGKELTGKVKAVYNNGELVVSV